MTKKLLLHVCCAPCGAYSAKFLKQEGYDVTFYFYNPNIFPEEEYYRRLYELEKFCAQEEYSLIIEEPDFQQWEEKIFNYKNEPERGKRCYLCYQIRLDKTAQYAKKMIDLFA